MHHRVPSSCSLRTTHLIRNNIGDCLVWYWCKCAEWQPPLRNDSNYHRLLKHLVNLYACKSALQRRRRGRVTQVCEHDAMNVAGIFSITNSTEPFRQALEESPLSNICTMPDEWSLTMSAASHDATAMWYSYLQGNQLTSPIPSFLQTQPLFLHTNLQSNSFVRSWLPCCGWTLVLTYLARLALPIADLVLCSTNWKWAVHSL